MGDEVKSAAEEQGPWNAYKKEEKAAPVVEESGPWDAYKKSSKADQESPIAGAIVGAPVGALVETPKVVGSVGMSAIDKLKNIGKPEVEASFRVPKVSPHGQLVDEGVPPSVYKWMVEQHSGVPIRGANMKMAEQLAQEFHEQAAKRTAFEQANPGRTLSDAGLDIPLDDHLKAKDVHQAEVKARMAAEDILKKQEARALGKQNILKSNASHVGGGVLGGALAGANLADFQNAQDPFRKLVSGAGTAGSTAAMLSRNPKARLYGIGAGAVAPVINRLLPQSEGYANGGLVHLAEGGEPQMGEARAYEPTYNERIMQALMPYLGQQQARALMGGQGAQNVDQLNPIGWMAQMPGNVAQHGKEFVNAAKQGDYLGGAGAYLGGAMEAAPLMSKTGKLAKLLELQGGNRVLDRATTPVNMAMEKLMAHLPESKYANILAKSKLKKD